jgi:hypothetical protein
MVDELASQQRQKWEIQPWRSPQGIIYSRSATCT